MSGEYEALAGQLDLPAKVRLLTGGTCSPCRRNRSIGLRADAPVRRPHRGPRPEFSGGRTRGAVPQRHRCSRRPGARTPPTRSARCSPRRPWRQQIHVVLGPTINLHRSPLGGRLFEAYSEDPLLTGKLAAAYVRGLQSSGVGACLKHLVANESETERNTMNSVVDEATLRELYLLPFEIAVEESDPWSIMAAYNDVNGVPATEQDHVRTRSSRASGAGTG